MIIQSVHALVTSTHCGVQIVGGQVHSLTRNSRVGSQFRIDVQNSLRVDTSGTEMGAQATSLKKEK